jgi:metallo-beta-lactamase family protein
MSNSVTLQFLGAAGTVTGSRFALHSNQSTVLVDAGLFQGLKELRLKNWDQFPIKPSHIDAIVLTHAHLDHCGYLPALVRDGFNGKIFATEWTIKLAEVILRDSARLQMEDAEYAARKGYSKHSNPKPIYTTTDVEATLPLFVAVDFRQPVAVTPDCTAIFYPSGHVLGSAFVEIQMADKRVVFTGDMGRPFHPLLRAPDRIPDGPLDAIITESTYGDRSHDVPSSVFADAINRTLKRGGSVLIPAFAVDRTEVILMELRRLMDEQTIPRVPVYADSPMALTTLDYYRQALKQSSIEIKPEIAAAYAEHDPFDPGTLQEVRSVEESIKLNKPVRPSIIISASGMATGGRVVHHLKGMLPNPNNTVLLVGFQAAGTRGRYLADGAESIKMYGKYVPVRAEVVQVGSFSVHADNDEMLGWLERADPAPTTVYVVHGEQEAADTFARRIRKDLEWLAVVPRDGEKVLL